MRRAALLAFYVGPLVVWMAVIFGASTPVGSAGHSAGIVACLVPRLIARFAPQLAVTPEGLELCNFFFRKAAHLAEYALLALLAARAFQFGRPCPRARSILLALLLSAAYAGADEFHQRFVPGRTPLFDDAMVDTVGALFALALLSAGWLERVAGSRLHARVLGSEAGVARPGGEAAAVPAAGKPAR